VVGVVAEGNVGDVTENLIRKIAVKMKKRGVSPLFGEDKKRYI
jgi:hypothetical protein